MNGVVAGFGKRLWKHHKLDFRRSDGSQKYWPLPFNSGPIPPAGGWPDGIPTEPPDGVSENGLFIWVLRPNLAEALEKLNLVGDPPPADPAEISEVAAAALPAEFRQGALKRRWVNAYERDDKARAACLAHHGAACQACGFDFAQAYGPFGAGFIHAHHLVPLAQIRQSYKVDPIRDLIPLCPNCHAMIHRGAASAREAMTLEDLRALIAEARQA